MRSSVNLSSNFLLMGGAVFPPCRLAWGQTIVGVMALMVTSSKRTYTSMLQDCFIRWPEPYSKPLLTHASSGDSWTLTGKSGSISCGVTAPFLNMPAMLENSAVATGLEKASFHSNPNSNVKKCSDYHTIALISHTSKECSKFSKLDFYSTWTENFQMLKVDFEKAEEPDIKLPTSVGSLKKQENSRKASTSVSLTMLKPLTGSEQTGNFLGRCEYQTTWPASLEICNLYAGQEATVRTRLTGLLDSFGFKLGKEYVKAVYCHPAYLTYMQSTSCKMLGWMKPKLESRLLDEVSVTSYIYNY